MSGAVRLIPNLLTTESAAVFILVPIRKDEEKRFPYGHRLPALGAVEFRGLELIKIGLLGTPFSPSILSVMIIIHFLVGHTL